MAVTGGRDTPGALNLAHAVLLLALDERSGKDRTPYGIDPSLAGAILVELLEGGSLVASGPLLVAADGDDPADELLEDALAVIRRSPLPRQPKGWIERLPKELKPLRARVARPLVEQGVLEQHRHRMLGLVDVARYPERDPGPEQRLRERLAEVLLGEREPLHKEAVLIALIRPHRLERGLVPRGHRREAARRAREIADRGVVDSAVRAVVRDTQRAIAPATVGVASFSGAGNGGGAGSAG